MHVCICVCIYVYTHTHREAYIHIDFLGGSVVNNPPTNAGDVGLIPGSGISAGEGNGNQLQYSCLGNPMDRGDWWALVHGVTKSWT